MSDFAKSQPRTHSIGHRRCRNERGQSFVALIAVLVIIIAAAFAMVELGAEATANSRIQSVADLVALAAVRGPEEAELVAAHNGATIVSMSRNGETVTITVSVDRRTATAAAEPDWTASRGN